MTEDKSERIYGDERKVIQQGSSLVVCISKNMWKSINAKKGDTVMIHTDGKQLVIEKKKD